ncbi:universal stress protein [Fulvivirga sediminis]|uniref:Universal stress protein n=1 Tax=Fulvivirga sediminis TaxID=2803949 RepID=A0A937FAF1_9BACT|nr:universal stress protein [Fulvivirga sediminis]MBL3658261.1 universal stress protein [Fulvivirga sediminis]
MKRILVPVDFSEQAKFALNFASELNDIHKDVKVTVLHAVEHPLESYLDPTGLAVGMGADAELMQVMKENATKAMKTFIEETLNEAQAQQVNFKIVMGTAYECIQEELEEEDYYMVIMGTKGASGIKEMFVGSNAEKVVRLANCPVITLTRQVCLKTIKNIVFATATLADISKELLAEIKQLQELFDARIQLVRINTPNNFERDSVVKQALQQIADRYRLTNYTLNIYNDQYEEQGIIAFAEEIGADMIAIGTHGRQGLAHLLYGSLAEDIVNHASYPIWTYHISETV